MPSHLHQARLWLERRRYDLAEPALVKAAAENPDDAMTRVLLAHCLLDLGRGRDALVQAKKGVALTPDMAEAHQALAAAHLEIGDLSAARTAANEALRLEPDDSRAHGLLAAVYLAAERWHQAVTSAERGLGIDPTDALCGDVRARALSALDRPSEAAHASAENLRQRPDDAAAHATHAYTCLHSGRPQEAVEHYAQALRRDSTDDAARSGFVLALKARYPVYRILLSFVFWMRRLTTRQRVFLFVAAYILVKLLGPLDDTSSPLRPLILAVLAAYLLFVLLTWLGDPLFNLLLLFNRSGRLAMSASDRASGVALAVLGVLGIAALTTGCIFITPWLVQLGIVALMLTIPVTSALSMLGDPAGRVRLTMAAALVATAAASVVLRAIGSSKAADSTSLMFALGVLIFMWSAVVASIRGRNV